MDFSSEEHNSFQLCSLSHCVLLISFNKKPPNFLFTIVDVFFSTKYFINKHLQSLYGVKNVALELCIFVKCVKIFPALFQKESKFATFIPKYEIIKQVAFAQSMLIALSKVDSVGQKTSPVELRKIFHLLCYSVFSKKIFIRKSCVTTCYSK